MEDRLMTGNHLLLKLWVLQHLQALRQALESVRSLQLLKVLNTRHLQLMNALQLVETLHVL